MIEVYTAITGGKDAERKDIKVFSEYNKFADPVMNAKIYKILPHKFLDCDISIWLDGNIFLTVSPEKLVNEWLGEADIAVVGRQPNRNMEWEVWALGSKYKHNKPGLYQDVINQYEHYKKNNLVGDGKLFKCGVIIRRHNDIVRKFNEAWWAEICRWSERDQLSFPVIIKKFKIKFNPIEENETNLSYTRYERHRFN